MTEKSLGTLEGAQEFAAWIKNESNLVRLFDVHGVPLAAIPSGGGGATLHSVKKLVDEYRVKPEAIAGTAELLDLDSLIAHAKRFMLPESALYAGTDGKTAKIVAIYDYHEPSDYDIKSEAPAIVGVSDPTLIAARARFVRHGALYRFPLSDEWVAWHAQANKWLGAEDFVAFLEDRVLDVVGPPFGFEGETYDVAAARLVSLMGGGYAGPERLMTMARHLKITREDRAESKVDRNTGEVVIAFSSLANESTGSLKPEPLFRIQIPVFKQDAVYRIDVRLRHKLAGGKVLWAYELYQPERRFDDAFRTAARQVQISTGLPMFFGHAENGWGKIG